MWKLPMHDSHARRLRDLESTWLLPLNVLRLRVFGNVSNDNEGLGRLTRAAVLYWERDIRAGILVL